MFSRIEDFTIDYAAHLVELRRRLFVCVLAMVGGVIAGWCVYPYAYPLLAGPVINAVREHHGQIIATSTTGPLFTQMKLALILGLILASPVILWQIWGFIRPGLLPHERKAVRPLMPGICGLFLLGALTAYLMMPGFMAFFMSFFPPGVMPYTDYEHSIDLPSKVMVAFGISFQLPIVMLGLVKLRVLTPRILLSQWRVAIVVIAVIAAVVTPTTDPFSMTLLMIPLLVLYFGTVLIAFRMAPRDAAVEGDTP